MIHSRRKPKKPSTKSKTKRPTLKQGRRTAGKSPKHRHRPKPTDSEIETAVRLMRSGDSRKQAAKKAGVPESRLSRFLQRWKIARFKNGRWRFTDRRRREVTVFTTLGIKKIKVRGFEAASKAMSHLNAVSNFQRTNDASLLEPFEGESIRDTRGRKHYLATQPNTIYRLAAAETNGTPEIYRLDI